MSQVASLEKLDRLLETFLDHIVDLKESRLSVLEGIDSLDEIARMSGKGFDTTDRMGDWFARHNRWLTDNCLKESDFEKISNMFSELGSTIESSPKKVSPANRKINSEINRWNEAAEKNIGKIVLKRPPEEVELPEIEKTDSISLFVRKLSKTTAMFMDHSADKQHILSVLDDVLTSAYVQQNKDALILSGFIIYYLKQNGYKVEPYVKKLKRAEKVFVERTLDAKRR